jgi:predicted ATPase
MKISKKVKLELYKALEKEQKVFPSDDKWMNFLDEVWNLRTLPSEDGRYTDAYDDIVQHTVNNYDYELEYLFIEKLKLLESDEIFIKFLNTLIHPNFRENSDEIISLVFLINSYIEKENLILAIESYDEYEIPIYKIIKQKNAPTYNDLLENKIQFFVDKGIGDESNPTQRVKFRLVFNNAWNDYGFKTEFKLYYYNNDLIEEIGIIKIGNLENSVPDSLPNNFTRLDESYCSLGQSYDFYSKLKDIMGKEFESILYALKDVAFFPEIYDKFENNETFKTSLIRYDEVEQLSRVVKYKLYGFDLNNLYDFKYNFLPKYSTDAVDIEFNFTNNSDFPNRIYSIIGKNGTGKTQFITSLPLSISKKEDNKFTPRTPIFSKVIAVSYSIFDNFEKPKSTSYFNYIYCGLLDDKGELLTDRKQLLRFHKTWKRIEELNRTYEWYEVLNNFIDTTILNEFCTIDNDNRICEINRQEFNKLRKNFSSGQTILLYIMTEIIANIRRDSLLLFDEPETHLHPNAISQLMNVIYELVNKFQSYCIITTHSPLIVQEVLSKSVKVIEKHENLVSVRQIAIESFGANLTTLTEEVFGNREIQKQYKKIINRMISNGKSYDDIVGILEREGFPLSINISLYIKSQLV